MGNTHVNLAALIGSRICHDLISPIGAINNGLELLGMAGATEGPELELISQSVENASARIRYFRIAYGAASKQAVGRAEIVGILKDTLGPGRLDVAWGPLDAQPRDVVRMAFLAIQCLENAMPYGGRIEVTCERERWTVHGRSDKMNLSQPLWAGLEAPDSSADIAPSQVQFALLPAVASDAGRKLKIATSPTDITIAF